MGEHGWPGTLEHTPLRSPHPPSCDRPALTPAALLREPPVARGTLAALGSHGPWSAVALSALGVALGALGGRSTSTRAAAPAAIKTKMSLLWHRLWSLPCPALKTVPDQPGSQGSCPSGPTPRLCPSNTAPQLHLSDSPQAPTLVPRPHPPSPAYPTALPDSGHSAAQSHPPCTGSARCGGRRPLSHMGHSRTLQKRSVTAALGPLTPQGAPRHPPKPSLHCLQAARTTRLPTPVPAWPHSPAASPGPEGPADSLPWPALL